MKRRMLVMAMVSAGLALLCLAYTAVLIFGQASDTTKKEPPILRVRTRLVQVNVLVEDKSGNPVADLTREDFILTEKGQPQTISLFSMELSRPPETVKPLPPNTFTNRSEYRAGTPPSVTVVLLDGLNTRFQDQAYAKTQIIKFLEQLQPHDRVALYALGTRLRVLHDFTGDAAPLLRALERYKGHQAFELDASQTVDPGTERLLVLPALEGLDEWVKDALQQVEESYTIRRVQQTLHALEAIANHLAQLPGRKNLIWVSGSFPSAIGMDVIPTPDHAKAERRIFSAETERALRALNNANLAIYPVDVRGLIGVFDDPDPNFRQSRALGVVSPVRPNILGPSADSIMTMGRTGPSYDSMNILAERTGGRAFYNTNDIYGSIRRAVDDTRVTYTLGYYPNHDQWDGKFREIKVQVQRPGLHVRHRRGYFAMPESPHDEKQRQAELSAALWSPLEATNLSLSARVEPANPSRTRILKVAVQVDARNVSLTTQDEHWNGTLDILWAQVSAEGKILTQSSQALNLHMGRENYERVVKGGVLVTRHLEIADGAYQLRIIARDRPSGALGSINIPVASFAPKAEK